MESHTHMALAVISPSKTSLARKKEVYQFNQNMTCYFVRLLAAHTNALHTSNVQQFLSMMAILRARAVSFKDANMLLTKEIPIVCVQTAVALYTVCGPKRSRGVAAPHKESQCSRPQQTILVERKINNKYKNYCLCWIIIA